MNITIKPRGKKEWTLTDSAVIVGNKEIYSYFYDNKLQSIKEEVNDKLSF